LFFVILQHLTRSGWSVVVRRLSEAVSAVLPFLALGLAILMVSRIRYPHVLNQYLRGKKPFGHFIRVLLLLAFLAWQTEVALVLIFCGFAASSLIRWIYFRMPVSSLLARLSPWAIRQDDDALIPHSAGHSPASAADGSEERN